MHRQALSHLVTRRILLACFVSLFPHALFGQTVAEPRLPLYPLDVAVADDGSIYVADRNLPGVWKWQSGELSVFYQGSPKYRTPLNAPRCIAIDNDGTVLVGDSSTREVYRVKAGQEPEPITGGVIGIPMDLAVAKDGTIYVADLELRYLMKIPAGGSTVERIASVNPRGVFVDQDQQVWVVSQDSAQILKVAGDGQVEKVVDKRTFEFPHQMVVDESGTAFVTDGYQKAIWKLPAGGEPEAWVKGDPLDNPVGIALAGDKLLVVDPRARAVFEIDSSGAISEKFKIALP